MLQDKLLIWRLRHGSEDALRRIYQKYENYLLTIAVNLLSDPSGAEDVVQEVFMQLVQTIDSLEITSSLKGYLATCTANRSRDVLRKRKRHSTVDISQAGHAVSNEDGPVQMAIHSELLLLLNQAMTKLPYEQRETIVLRVNGRLKFKAIAQMQNVSIKTAQSRYRYGLDKLRSLLNGEVKK